MLFYSEKKLKYVISDTFGPFVPLTTHTSDFTTQILDFPVIVQLASDIVRFKPVLTYLLRYFTSLLYFTDVELLYLNKSCYNSNTRYDTCHAIKQPTSPNIIGFILSLIIVT